MRFAVDDALLRRAREALAPRPHLHWVLGGAGSGKSTVCRRIAARYNMPLCDMDARIYGSYGPRYTAERHSANYARARAADPLAWSLEMGWEAFQAYGRAADAEYLDLLAAELAPCPPEAPLLVDGGLSNPGLLARVIPVQRIVCLARAQPDSAAVWEGSEERRAMRDMLAHLPDPDAAWLAFLRLDACLTRDILRQAQDHGIRVVTWDDATTPDALADEVARLLGIATRRGVPHRGTERR